MRTDDDSWDITKSVGATALGVAYARSHESASERPLFVDPHAKQFIDAMRKAYPNLELIPASALNLDSKTLR